MLLVCIKLEIFLVNVGPNGMENIVMTSGDLCAVILEWSVHLLRGLREVQIFMND